MKNHPINTELKPIDKMPAIAVDIWITALCRDACVLMAEQLSLVVLILALATGLVTSIVSVTYSQGRQPEFFRDFWSLWPQSSSVVVTGASRS